MRGILVILGAGLACSAQGGTITSGSFFVSAAGLLSATVSGEDFTAKVADVGGPFLFSNLFPFQNFQAQFFALSWGGAEFNSGVLFNGFFYPVPSLPVPSGPFAGIFFTETPISPRPIVTGPGTYNLDLFSVQLDFTLRDSSGTLLHSETDTGFATGSITYRPSDTPGFLHADGFTATIIPEPSTWSCIAFAACCLAGLKRIRLDRGLGSRMRRRFT